MSLVMVHTRYFCWSSHETSLYLILLHFTPVGYSSTVSAIFLDRIALQMASTELFSAFFFTTSSLEIPTRVACWAILLYFWLMIFFSSFVNMSVVQPLSTSSRTRAHSLPILLNIWRICFHSLSEKSFHPNLSATSCLRVVSADEFESTDKRSLFAHFAKRLT